ncbi:carboxypeptidase-like regulatory domain-containing protein [Pseudomonas sp. EA_35y_Pfl2_R5]|uniref:carboxypeptidase-like regulatory domain-containing protein n=1 Tax=Pseudomonas sp. EA_35y_Pfl2_R5 TaxID=3088690 RepID=UPI0030DCAAE1
MIYPHTVPVNPPIEGSLVSVESGQPVSGAELTLNVGSDMARIYKTSSDANGRFAFAAHSDFRLITLLEDAPPCNTVLTIEAPGYKPRHCLWMVPHWCSGVPPVTAFKDLKLIPQHMPNDYAEIQATNNWPCDDPTAGMNN